MVSWNEEIKVRITKNQLIDIAIQSVKERSNLSMFWDYVIKARECGLLRMSTEQVNLLLNEYENLIYGKGFQKQEEADKLPNFVSTFGLDDSTYRSRVVEGDPLDNFMSKTIDISPLKQEIPDYASIIQPKPDKVYLLDKLTFWPLFKVVGVHRVGGRNMEQLYLVGKDRHTKQPFALGIPNGFIDMPFEACLRWTLDAHKGDEVIEV